MYMFGSSALLAVHSLRRSAPCAARPGASVAPALRHSCGSEEDFGGCRLDVWTCVLKKLPM
eukprot:15931161-Heterocapsa_arctica.AAC.1